jgi:catechol 2,3-dioxygenase
MEGGPAPQLDPATGMGAVRLRARDLDALRGFYERVIGLEALEGSDSLARLGAGERVLVELTAAPDAPARPRVSTGLFHLAILVPDRPRLGAALRRLGEAEWPLTGASDHLVSEALYTRDPEGNGIEIYRDRPREEWSTANGELAMDTLPLDLGPIAAEAEGAAPMAPGTRIGHVHLNVAGIPDTEAFYCGLLGFEATVRSYPGALFVAAGGYHHHLGLNTWVGEGAPAPPAGGLGLDRFEVVVPGGGDVEAVAGRLEAADHEPERVDGGIEVPDPSSNRVLIRAASGAAP